MKSVSMNDLVVALLLTLAVGALTTTITKAKVCHPLRTRVQQRSYWLGYLMSCPYCMSHWLSFALVAYYQPRVIRSDMAALDCVVTAFVIVALAAVPIFALSRVYTFASSQRKTSVVP